jgi:hypothetical protein
MRGGKREGAGRKNSGTKITTSFRLTLETYLKAKEKYKRELNKMVDNFIKQLSDESN